MIPHTRVIQWMNVIREEKGSQQARILENFWASQLNSKAWLINNVNSYCDIPENPSIYIFGGWYGILAQLLRDVYPKADITSIDKDMLCASYGRELMLPNDNINFVTCDMKNFKDYSPHTSLVINTSTEHITQETYDNWIMNVPENVLVALQGNNFFNCEEHIRCSETLDMFEKMNPLSKYKIRGGMGCGTFTRWMTIGYK